MIAVPLMTLSSMAFSVELPQGEPMTLTTNQMDSITAGRHIRHIPAAGFQSANANFFNLAAVTQSIYAPVTIVQIGDNNTAIVYSFPSNRSTIRQ